MITRKKAELTLETIVIAVLVLVVMAILLFIAYRYIWGSGKEVGLMTQCQSRADGAECVTETEDCDGTKFFKMGGCNKDNGGEYCCVPNPKEEK